MQMCHGSEDEAPESRMTHQPEPLTDPPNDSHGEITLWLRIGVFGHRGVSPDHPGLAQAIETVLARVTHLQASIPVVSTRVGLAVVSALGEGADRILVRAVLAREGTRLEAILPFDREQLRCDFLTLESQREFDRLAEDAIVDVIGLTLRGAEYASAGRTVISRSDVVIAIWDGKPRRAGGSTADLYDYAVERGKPVFWIRTDSESAELAESPATLDYSDLLLAAEALKHLDRYNRKHVAETPFIYAAPLMNEAGASDGEGDAAAMLGQHMSQYLVRANTLAGRFQRRYYWATGTVYALTALAVAIVAAQILYAPGQDRYAWFEFAALVCVTVVIVRAPFDVWRDRWISSGYLAEQIRSLVFLGLAGVDTPDNATFVVGPQAGLIREFGWTERAFSEIWWSRPRYDLSDDVGELRSALTALISDQLSYHISVRRTMEDRARRFSIATTSLFAISVLVALLHSLGVGPELVRPATPWDYFSIVIPAVAAAITGYAGVRNYQRRAERETRLAVLLRDARYQLAVSENLDRIQKAALDTSRQIKSETSDWYAVVRSKHIEP